MFVKNNHDGFKSAIEFAENFKEVMKPNISTNKYHEEYKLKLDKEMQKFNGKTILGDNTETNSEMTTATGKTKASKKSSQKANSRAGSPGVDDLDDAEAMHHGDDVRSRAMADDDGQYDEDQADLDKKNENPLKELFADPKDLALGKTNYFDPKKKFGIIESESLLYDNVTTSYPLNMPTDHYDKFIKNNMPTKETKGGSEKWYIRPHHLETLTHHPLSVKDDVLNTRYISHYNQEYGKKEERNDNGEAINYIESHLETLKSQMTGLMMARGKNPEFMEELHDNMRLEGA